MTTDTPDHPAWKARALELADALVSAQVNDDREHGLIAARAALAAHLDGLPMGPVVAWVGSDSVLSMRRMSDRGSCTTTLYKVSQGDMDCVPLYRHPKESE